MCFVLGPGLIWKHFGGVGVAAVLTFWAERAAVALPSLVLGKSCSQGIFVGVAVLVLRGLLGELEQRHLLGLGIVASVC